MITSKKSSSICGATAPVLLGLSIEQLADVLAPAPVGVCGWLDGSCCERALPGDWLCAGHRKQITPGGAR